MSLVCMFIRRQSFHINWALLVIPYLYTFANITDHKPLATNVYKVSGAFGLIFGCFLKTRHVDFIYDYISYNGIYIHPLLTKLVKATNPLSC